MKLLDTGPASADANMRMDEKLLMDLAPDGEPILHLYQWEGPSATYGYFIEPTKHIDMDKARASRISLARRPTGGGIVFHIWDLAFSFLMPSGHPSFSMNTLENYRFVNQSVLEVMREYLYLRDPLELLPQDIKAEALSTTHFCMARPTAYDVIYQGKKIAGAAQRRRQNGYLHQGTISLALPQAEIIVDLLKSQKEVIQAMMAYSFAPLGLHWKPADLLSMRKEIGQRLANNLQAKSNL